MIRTLLTELIDYAGLFPPAALAMQPAVANYAGYRAGPRAYALARFVVPVARLEELEAALPGTVDYPWRVSALLSGNTEADLAAIGAFNERQDSRAIVDAVELRVQTPDQIEIASRSLAQDFTVYFEIPMEEDPVPFVAAIAAGGGRAKIRTGGVTPAAFPPAAGIMRFLVACARAGVPFKATAGLHHPLRCLKPLTDSADAPRGWMFGFLNVFLAASWIHFGLDPKAIAPLLDEQDPGAFRFDENSVTWRRFRLTAAEAERARSRFAISFGSCSFEEPISDLQLLGLL